MCVTAALICSALRVQRPEIATAVSLACGLAVLGMVLTEIGQSVEWMDGLRALTQDDGGIAALVIKAAGISLIAELGAQVCNDSGESALAGRIMLASRVAVLGLCAPLLAEIAGLLESALF